MQGDLPPVSILISSKDRRGLLDRALASLAELDYPRDRIEIVVVEETDDARPLPGIRYVPIPRENKGYGYTRNVAVAHAQHDILAFTDDDCVVDPVWLRELVTPLTRDTEVAGVAGAVRVQSRDLLAQCENILGFPEGGLRYIAASGGRVVPTRYLSTCNCAYRKQVVLEADGFDVDTMYSGEDYLLAQRITARHRCVFSPGAVVFHAPRGSVRGIFWWFVRRGRSDIQLWNLVSDPRRHLFRGAYASLTVRSLVTLPFLVWAGEKALPLLGLLAGLYYLTMLWRYRYALHFSRPVGAYLLTPMVKAVMDAGMGAGHRSLGTV